MKTVTINGQDFAVYEKAKTLSIADNVPQQVGDTITLHVYDLQSNPPKYILTKGEIADAEYIAMMEQIKFYERKNNE